ncbi:TcpQ domain-containing protein [Photorhabdus temperata]|nr:TcpQ domain-containing protein [Photorhabdus temperata]
MRTEKIIMVSLVANALLACSSPPKLNEPEGDWISFEPVVSQSSIAQQSTNTLYSSSNLLVNNMSPAPQSMAAVPAKQLDYSKVIFVMFDGKNVPLYKAVRDVVPASLMVKLSPDVAQNFRGNVSWIGNDQWPYVLRKMLTSAGLDADINDSRKEVVVKYAKPSAPLSGKPLVDKPALPGTPDKGSNVIHPPLVPVVTLAPAQSVTDKPKLLIKPVPVLKVWKIDKGTSLKNGFDLWVSKEKCPVGNGKWNIRWNTDTDYPIDYPLSFTSKNFEDATSQLFNLYRKAQAPLYVSGYRNQCLIVISDRK